MTLDQCYHAMGAPYEEVLSRLRSERLIQKYVLKFLDDPSYENLCAAISSSDDTVAFRAIHTLKGVAQNLGFAKLYQSSAALTEALRNGRQPGADALFSQVMEDDRMTVEAISQFQASLDAGTF